MSLIDKISRLKHPGVLRDFTWPTDLPTFARFNLIYGWNGSGKTTLSRLFRCLEQRSVPSAGEATLRIDGRDVNETDFSQANIHIRVFNRDFVNESVFPGGGGDVPPIFVVGKESVEKQKEADRMKTDKSTKEAGLARARTSSQTAARELDKHCTDQAKVIKDSLRVPGAGKYNEYDKRAYREKAQQMAEANDAPSHLLDDATRDNLLIQHRATIKPKLPQVEYRLPSLNALHEEVAECLVATVTSWALQGLRDDAQLGAWARQGLQLHKERKAEVCLFCEQSLTPGRLAALEAHFSIDYDRLLQHVDEIIGRLKEASLQASDLRPPDRATLYEDLKVDYDSAQQTVQEVLQKVTRFLDSLILAVEQKRGQPFRSLELQVAVTEIDTDAVNRLNEVIERHNKACDDFQVRTATAGDRLALDMIARTLDDYSRLAVIAKSAADAIGPMESDVQRLSGEIVRLEREIVEHRQPAEELNEDLRKYLGHDELRLEVKDTGYILTRGEVPADSLSEGERTALALLYFLKSLTDRRFDLRRGVVVLDDPVSSLDANALYLAFGFIRQRTQDATQLFLMTHNFTFFRQVRNWFRHLKGQNKNDITQRPARFYMLDRVRDADVRCTTIRPLDPLLEEYESEYHYLFACVHREVHAGADAKLERNYRLPNMARRLLEMFLAFRRPQVAGELWHKLRDVKFDEAKKLRIARFVHTHSHGDTIGEPEHDPSLLGEACSVLTDLLELIKSEDAQHFAAMVDLVTGPEEEAYPE